MKHLMSTMAILVVVSLPFGLTSAWAAPPVDKDPVVDAASNGSLLVFPKRVVFSGRERSAVITLVNSGSQATTFRLELSDFLMDQEGRLVPYGDEEEPKHSLKSMVRFSPRQIKVEPGERQTVRVFVRKPPNLAVDEYRSHLHLRALPATDQGPRVEDFQEEQDNALSLRITALPAISLPIIVRHGELDASLSIEILDLLESDQGTARGVSLRLDRQGNRSVYGDISAYWQAAGSSNEILVGRAKGVAVYTTVNRRTFNLALRLPKGLGLDSGALKVAFESRPDLDGGGAALLAHHEMTRP